MRNQSCLWGKSAPPVDGIPEGSLRNPQKFLCCVSGGDFCPKNRSSAARLKINISCDGSFCILNPRFDAFGSV